MRILLINVVCGQGSTGKIVFDLYNTYMRLGHEARVFYGRGPKREDPCLIKVTQGWEVYLHALSARLTGWVGRGNGFSIRRLLRKISDFKPDIVHLHNIHGYYTDAYKLLAYLKKNEIPTVLTMHDEWSYTGKCGHVYDCKKWLNSCGGCPQLSTSPKSFFFDRTAQELIFKKEAFNGFKNIVFVPVSEWLKNQAKQSTIMFGKRFQSIYNGLDLEVFHPCDAQALREKHGLLNEKIIVHVTPDFDDPRKGGRFVIDLACRLKNQNLKIIIIGAVKPIDNCPENVIPIPHTENQRQLAEYYSLGDILVLTSEKETFSMVCAEALCCGTPVVGFDSGAPIEVAPSPYGIFVPYGNMSSLEAAVRSALGEDGNLPDRADVSHYASSRYCKNLMAGRYLSLYEEICKGVH